MRLTRAEVIDTLVEQYLQMDGLSTREMDNVFGDMIRNGFRGYSNLTDEELAVEYANQTGEMWEKINEDTSAV